MWPLLRGGGHISAGARGGIAAHDLWRKWPGLLGLFEPVQILADQQFRHFGMMRVFHGDWATGKPVTLSKNANFVSVIVRHDKRPRKLLAQGEQAIMVDFAVPIKARPCTLSTGSIGRVDEESCVGVVLVSHHYVESIRVDEMNPLGDMGNVRNPLRDGLRIPTRENAFAVFAGLYHARAFRKNTTVRRPVSKESLKGAFKEGCRRLAQFSPRGINR